MTDTPTTTDTWGTAAGARMKETLGERLLPSLRAITQQLTRLMDNQYLRANTVVHVAGLEARYYVRGAMDPTYATPEGLRALRRRVLTGADPDLLLLTPANRRLVLVSAMRGWETRGEVRLWPVECDRAGACAYADAVGMPDHGSSCTGELWRCEGMTAVEPPLVAHRQWGTTAVEVRCG